MVEVMDIEPKPGIPPSAGYLAELVDADSARRRRRDHAQHVHRPEGAAVAFASTRGVPLVDLPYTVGGTPGAKDLFGLFDDIIARLEKVRN